MADMSLEKKMKEWDCTKCKFRTSKVATNRGTQCEIGYTQNPRTVEATRNLIANGGKVCLRHPMKYEDIR